MIAACFGVDPVSSKASTHFIGFDFAQAFTDKMKGRLPGLGLNIMWIAGFSYYMDKIGASKALVKACVRPLSAIRSPYVLLAVTYVIGQFMALFINSAVGLGLLLFVISKGRRFDGENTWFYFLWYGLGRSWIEGLRTDSLYLFNWELFGQRIRVSQALSIVMVAVAAFMLFYNIRIKKRSPESLWVHQVAAEKARLAAAEAEDVVLAETLMNEAPTEGEAADPLETEAVESPDAETVPDTETQEKPEKGETHGNEN